MDTTDVVRALNWEYGAKLGIDAGKTRLRLSEEDLRRLPAEVLEGIRDNHDELLRGEIFKDGLRRLHEYLTERYGADPEGATTRAALAAMSHSPEEEALNDAFRDESLEEFKVLVDAWLRVGAVAFKKRLRSGRGGEGGAPLGEKHEETTGSDPSSGGRHRPRGRADSRKGRAA